MALRFAATRPHLSLVANGHRILVITASKRRHNSNEPSANQWMVYLHTPRRLASPFLLLVAFFAPAGAAALARQLVEDLYVSD